MGSLLEERQTDRRYNDCMMQDQLDTLSFRVGAVENALEQAKQVQVQHMAQTAQIHANTQDLLETFNALKGAWKVLDMIGKMSKPITVVASFGAVIWWIKDHAKDLIKWP